jgi:hypothetical protein
MGFYPLKHLNRSKQRSVSPFSSKFTAGESYALGGRVGRALLVTAFRARSARVAPPRAADVVGLDPLDPLIAKTRTDPRTDS